MFSFLEKIGISRKYYSFIKTLSFLFIASRIWDALVSLISYEKAPEDFLANELNSQLVALIENPSFPNLSLLILQQLVYFTIFFLVISISLREDWPYSKNDIALVAAFFVASNFLMPLSWMWLILRKIALLVIIISVFLWISLGLKGELT